MFIHSNAIKHSLNPQIKRKMRLKFDLPQSEYVLDTQAESVSLTGDCFEVGKLWPRAITASEPLPF
jgi:hypothetical protein